MQFVKFGMGYSTRAKSALKSAFLCRSASATKTQEPLCVFETDAVFSHISFFSSLSDNCHFSSNVDRRQKEIREQTLAATLLKSDAVVRAGNKRSFESDNRPAGPEDLFFTRLISRLLKSAHTCQCWHLPYEKAAQKAQAHFKSITYNTSHQCKQRSWKLCNIPHKESQCKVPENNVKMSLHLFLKLYQNTLPFLSGTSIALHTQHYQSTRWYKVIKRQNWFTVLPTFSFCSCMPVTSIGLTSVACGIIKVTFVIHKHGETQNFFLPLKIKGLAQTSAKLLPTGLKTVASNKVIFSHPDNTHIFVSQCRFEVNKNSISVSVIDRISHNSSAFEEVWSNSSSWERKRSRRADNRAALFHATVSALLKEGSNLTCT